MKKTIILRHRKENLKKCSLRGLETREDFEFFSYPNDLASFNKQDLTGFIYLTMNADTELSSDDSSAKGLFLIDATWKYAKIMESQIDLSKVICRKLPSHFKTAYPRKNTLCNEPESGLASVEAIYIAHRIMNIESNQKNPLIEGLLDNYYWKEQFLQINNFTNH
jgi:pre-rRNA-processing protein TSR3